MHQHRHQSHSSSSEICVMTSGCFMQHVNGGEFLPASLFSYRSGSSDARGGARSALLCSLLLRATHSTTAQLLPLCFSLLSIFQEAASRRWRGVRPVRVVPPHLYASTRTLCLCSNIKTLLRLDDAHSPPRSRPRQDAQISCVQSALMHILCGFDLRANSHSCTLVYSINSTYSITSRSTT